jgi:8-oxo-dGTP diphosphatase
MNKKTEYVVGFLFSNDKKQVVLIEKNRPEWQIGKLNGIGGHIEENETPKEAMKREFKEEAGLDINDWKQFARIEFDRGIVYFFYSINTIEFVTTTTDEMIVIVPTSNININHSYIYPNLSWLIPLALDIENHKGIINNIS